MRKMNYKERLVDIDCGRSKVRVCIVCCTCRDCYYCNRVDKKDPIFGEDMPTKFFCHLHEKEISPDGDTCENFK